MSELSSYYRAEPEKPAWWIWLFRGLGFFISLFFLLPNVFYRPVGSGVDPNWEIALHHFFENGFIFGDEVIFTYGPLGVLHARLAYPGITNLLIAWDILLVISLVTCLALSYYSLTRVSELLVAVLLCACVGIYRQPLDSSVLSLFFSLYFSLLLAQRQSIVAGLLGWLFATISFYLKVSSGMVALAAVASTGIFLALFARQRQAAVVSLLAGICLFTGFTFVLPVELTGYLRYSFDFISGYTEAMHKVDPGNRHYLTMAFLLVLLFLLSFSSAAIRLVSLPTQLLACGYAGGLLFLLFKQGFVRADSHIFDFFQYAPLVLVFCYARTSTSVRRYFAPLAIALLVFAFSLPQKRFSYEYVPHKWKTFLNYLEVSQTTAAPGTVPTQLRPSKPLSAELVSLLSGKSVDLMTFQIYQLLRSDLEYRPRPVIQSYAAYTPALDMLNAHFFASERAPDVLLYSYTRVDDRNSFFDEAMTTLTVRSLYSLHPDADWSRKEGYLVLERNAKPDKEERSAPFAQPNFTSIEQGTLSIGDWLDVPDQNGLLYFTFDLNYNLLGAAFKFLYKAPPFYIELFTEDGRLIRSRAIPAQLRGGVLGNRAVLSLTDARTFFQMREDELLAVKKIRLESSWPWGVYPKGSYEFRLVSAE